MATVMDVSCKAKPIRKEGVYQAAKESNPDIVTINLGMNDSRECNWSNDQTYIDAYKALIADVKGWPSSPKVYIINSQPLYPPYPNKHKFDKHNANDVLPGLHRKIADATNTPLIDSFGMLGGTSLSKPALIADDGGHPNKQGHKEIANLIEKKLKSDGVLGAAMALATVPTDTTVTTEKESNAMPEPQLEAAPAATTPTDVPQADIAQAAAPVQGDAEKQQQVASALVPQ
jgi:hypothetical protein